MYERFTDRSRKVMQFANQEAQRFNHEYIGTEHILLGLIKEGQGVAANVLKNLDIDLRKLRLEIEKIVQTSLASEMVLMGKLPQTPRAKKVIEFSIEEARNLNHNYVGTEHLLLGLLREEEGVAAQVLMNLGVSLEDAREEVLHLLGRNMPKTPDGSGERGPVKNKVRTTALDHIGRVLTQLAQDNGLDSVGGRAGVVARCREHLNCLERRSLLLVTDSAFAGRTAIAGLAQALVAEAVPGAEPAWRMVEFSLRQLWLTAANRGAFKDRLRAIQTEARAAGNLLICLADLNEALIPEAPSDLPIFARQLLLSLPGQLLAAIRPHRYRHVVESVPELARVVRPLMVPPPTNEEVVNVLRGLRDRYTLHHRVRYVDEALVAAAELSARMPGPQPDTALQVLDLAGARRSPPAIAPPDLQHLEEQLASLNRDKEQAVAEQDFARAAKLRDVADGLKKRREQIDREWRDQDRSMEGLVDVAVVAEVIDELAGDEPGPDPDAIR